MTGPHPPDCAVRPQQLLLSAMPTLNGVRAVLLDMGGVLLEMGNAQGMPAGKWDWRGREALLARLRQSGARLSED